MSQTPVHKQFRTTPQNTGEVRQSLQRIERLIQNKVINSSDKRWTIVASSRYTSIPTAAATIAMSNTEGIGVGLPIRFIQGGVTYYAIAAAVMNNASLSIAGPPFDTGEPITELAYGVPELVHVERFVIPDSYGNGVDDLLSVDTQSFFVWGFAPAKLVGFWIKHRVNAGTTQPKINLRIGSTTYASTNDSGNGHQPSTTWVLSGAVMDPDGYTILNGDEMEITCMVAGNPTGGAQDLSVAAVFVFSDEIDDADKGGPGGSSLRAYIYGGSDRGQVCERYDADADVWDAGTSLPTPGRVLHAAVTVTAKGYCMVGRNSASSTVLRDCDEFDAGGNSWASKADSPTPAREQVACGVVSSKAYIYSGVNGPTIQDNDEYEPATNTWTSKTDITAISGGGRQGSSGWSNATHCFCAGGLASTWLTQCDRYDPSGNSWASRSAMPSPGRVNMASAQIDDIGYVVGGNGSSGYFGIDCDAYTASVNAWSSQTNMPTPGRWKASATAMDGKVYEAGGEDSSGISLGDVDVFDPDTNSWMSVSPYGKPWGSALAASTA